MSTIQIFKVHYLTQKDKTHTIFVFIGENLEGTDYNNLFKTNPHDEVFNNIFNENELKEIRDKQIAVYFADTLLHLDDTIGMIKIKLAPFLTSSIIETDYNCSIDEMYLFCLKEETINPILAYQILTQNDTLTLTKTRLNQLLMNIRDEETLLPKMHELEEKAEYNFDDILSLSLDNDDKPLLVAKSIGQKFFMVTNEYPFVVDPFYVEEYDPLLERSRKELTTLNSHLLLNSGKIHNNTLYLCLAKDVFEFSEKKGITTEYTSKIYYPFLYKEQIEGIEDLEGKQQQLYEETNNLVRKSSTISNISNVNMFYEIYKYRQSTELFSNNGKKTGIKYMKVTIYPEYNVTLPVDAIFKLLHSTKDAPLIKYNPHTRQENIYRLYADKVTRDGRKIPYLPKGTIFKLTKLIARKRSVAVFTNVSYNGINYPLVCEFIDNGNLNVYTATELENVITIDETSQNPFKTIDTIFNMAISPLLDELSPFFKESGYNLTKFNSILDDNVEVIDMMFQSSFNIKSKIYIEKLRSCVTSIFNIESADFKKGIVMRYKRVANFNKLNSQEAFIIEKQKQDLTFQEIVDEVVANFDDVSKERAEEMVLKVIGELTVERGVKRKGIQIKVNPGFKTTMTVNTITDELTINIEGINDIAYLRILPIYLDTLVRLTQDINSTDYPLSKIKQLCSGTSDIEETYVPDVIAQSEKPFMENEVPMVSDTNIDYNPEPSKWMQYQTNTRMDSMIDMLMYDDSGSEEEGESSEVVGGVGSSSDEGSSSPLVSSESYASTSSSLSKAKKPVEITLKPNVAQTITDVINTEEDEDEEEEEEEEEEESMESKLSSLSDIEEGDIEFGEEMPMVETQGLAPISSQKSEETEEKSDESSSQVLSSVASLSSSQKSEEAEEKPDVIPSEKEAPVLAPDVKESPATEETSDVVSSQKMSATEETSEAKASEQKAIEVEDTKKSPELIEAPIVEDTKKSPDVLVAPEKQPSPISPVLPAEAVELQFSSSDSESSSSSSPISSSSSSSSLTPSSSSSKSSSSLSPVTVPEQKPEPTPIKPVATEKIQTLKKQMEHSVRDITGMNLHNLFQDRIERKDPKIFVSMKENPQMEGYSRMCPAAARRQPVILTKDERDALVAEHPELYDTNEKLDANFISYRDNPNKENEKLYYTCPQYWCLLTDKMVTKKDIMEGKCGGITYTESTFNNAIIPKTAKVVPKDKFVYKFFDDGEQSYPGFHNKEQPDGTCIPCCYSNWKTFTRAQRRQICLNKDAKKAEPSKVPVVEQKRTEEAEEIALELSPEEEEMVREIKDKEGEQYVKGPEKFPLGEARWGYLPIAIQKFLHEVNLDCQISKTNKKIKAFHSCILRHGVENSINQSFIACIANAMFYAEYDDKTRSPKVLRYLPEAKTDVPSIKEMKKIIIKSLTLDNFIKYHNGNLVTMFDKPELKVDVSKYSRTNLFKKAHETRDQGARDFLERAVKSFENYIAFLLDDKIVIDHVYLWDIICQPNPRLFEGGLNLIILEIPENDVTNNVELLCPTNQYSNHFYDARKKTLILIKRDNIFEPIYSYTDEEKRIKVLKTFSEYDPQLSKTLRAVFKKIIKPTIATKCQPMSSMPNKYTFKRPPLLDELISILHKRKYLIHSQVLNYQGKVIGLLVESHTRLSGFVPCYPSALTNLKQSKKAELCTTENCEINYHYMSDDIWHSYQTTLEFLSEFYDYDYESEHPCVEGVDLFRVIDENMVVGFLTNTNQFVPISEPLPKSEVPSDTLCEINNDNYLVADIDTQNSQKVDNERVNYVKKISLETNFYNVFRITVRILLNDYVNNALRKNIEEETNKRYNIYSDKLTTVKRLLKQLVGETIQFSESMDYNSIKSVSTCINTSSDKCEKDSNVCVLTGDKCTLVLPKTNLVTKADNEEAYFTKMADELIRYTRIKSFVFKPQVFFSFGEVKYNLRDNELLLLQSLLTQEFFEGMKEVELNKYARHNAFDIAKPIISIPYDNQIELDKVINPDEIRECFPSEPEKIKSIFWKRCFPQTIKEVVYSNNNYCTFYLVADIIKAIKNTNVSIDDLRNDLIEEYGKYTDDFKDREKVNKLADILIEEGKKVLGDQVKSGSLTFMDLIYTDSYYVTNTDIWILLVKYDIPCILLSSKNLPQTRFNEKEFVLHKTAGSDEYVFIMCPALRAENIPSYKLLVNTQTNKNLISFNDLSECEGKVEIEKAIKAQISFSKYVELFVRDKKTKYKPRKKGVRPLANIELVIEESEEE